MHTYLDAFVERRTFAMEYRLRCHDGEYRWVFDQGTPRFEGNGVFAGYIGSCVDVTEQREARDVLRQRNEDLEELVHERTELAEKRMVLLREVHHRIKNDLQLISSMLSMQGRRLSDADATAALEDCQGRVQTVAQIHEQVYRSDNLSSMRFSASVQSLVRRVFGVASPVPASVALEVEADDDIALTIERAIPSGLILRELVTNALKHGFPDGRSGRVLVSVRREEPERVVMQVADDGVGLVPGQNGGSLGWQLVQAFARQLGAEILVSHRDGTTVRVTFPLNA
jgi:two-component sensor histidine kinase